MKPTPGPGRGFENDALGTLLWSPFVADAPPLFFSRFFASEIPFWSFSLKPSFSLSNSEALDHPLAVQRPFRGLPGRPPKPSLGTLRVSFWSSLRVPRGPPENKVFVENLIFP